MSKLKILAIGGVGYVLGARAGRERYEQIKERAQGLWANPKVQQKATQARGYAKDKAAGAAASATAAAKDKVRGSSQDQSAAYPNGDHVRVS